jgi:hypothetical protein
MPQTGDESEVVTGDNYRYTHPMKRLEKRHDFGR